MLGIQLVIIHLYMPMCCGALVPDQKLKCPDGEMDQYAISETHTTRLMTFRREGEPGKSELQTTSCVAMGTVVTRHRAGPITFILKCMYETNSCGAIDFYHNHVNYIQSSLA